MEGGVGTCAPPPVPLLALSLLLLVTIVSEQGLAAGADAGAGVTLTPPGPVLWREENSTVAVTCSLLGTHELAWLDPHNKLIPQRSKDGRLGVLGGRSRDGHITQLRLLFNRLQPQDSGNYTCSAPKGSAASPAAVAFNLTVVEPVWFPDEEQQRQQTVRQFQNATLLCSPRGHPRPSVKWLRDGVPLPPPDEPGRSKYKLVSGGLRIANATREDAGTYVCRALQSTDENMQMRNLNITLTVEHEPDVRTWTSDQVYGYVGGAANLTCVAEAQPAGSIEWLRESKALKLGAGARVFGDSRNSTLQLSLKDASVFGGYTCKATNAVGTKERVVVLSQAERAPTPAAPAPLGPASTHSALLRLAPPPAAAAAASASANAGSSAAAAASTASPARLPLTGVRLVFQPSNRGDHPERVVDLDWHKDGEYELPDLQPGTWYHVWAMWRNAAGLSERSPSTEIHTAEASASRAAPACSAAAAALVAAAVAAIASS